MMYREVMRRTWTLIRRKPGIYSSGCQDSRRPLPASAARQFNARQGLRRPLGDDSAGRGNGSPPRAIRCRRKGINLRNAQAFLDPINSRAALSYERVAAILQVSVGSVKTLIHRLRKQYTSLLRQEVARTVFDPSEVDEEIHSLCEALIATRRAIRSMKAEERRACLVCGSLFPAAEELFLSQRPRAYRIDWSIMNL
jgi:hypothetical protein